MNRRCTRATPANVPRSRSSMTRRQRRCEIRSTPHVAYKPRLMDLGYFFEHMAAMEVRKNPYASLVYRVERHDWNPDVWMIRCRFPKPPYRQDTAVARWSIEIRESVANRITSEESMRRWVSAALRLCDPHRRMRERGPKSPYIDEQANRAKGARLIDAAMVEVTR